MKIKFKYLGIIIILFLFVNSATCFAESESSTYEVGDYILFGQYDNEPILWQVIHLDSNGNPLLSSAYILDYKVFDSMYKNYDNSSYDPDKYYSYKNFNYNYGSPIWDDSDLRKWLNYEGDDFEWLTYNFPPPANDFDRTLWMFAGPTSDDGTMISTKDTGFLSKNNFTDKEKSVILTTDVDFLLPEYRVHESTSGTEFFFGKLEDDDYVPNKTYNYAQSYSKTCQDKVFILSLQEVNNYLIDQNLSISGMKRHVESCSLFQNSYIFGRGQDPGNGTYWLRTPSRVSTASRIYSDVLLLHSSASTILFEGTPNIDSLGVKPAIYIDAQNSNIYKGTGDSKDPYIIAWEDSRIMDTIRSDCYYKSNDKICTSYLHLGDHIIFGKYNETPIDWEVINFNEYGNPLLLSKNILTIKSYDSNGPKYEDEDRAKAGSSNWEFSNIRQWLNSDEEQIEWLNNEPAVKKRSDYAYPYYLGSPYNTEPGFLYKDNFTDFEKSLITQYAHKDILSEKDKEYAINDVTGEPPNEYIEIGQYNPTDYYYKYINDKMFLLSVEEVKTYLYDRELDPRAQLPYNAWKGSWHDRNNNEYDPDSFFGYTTRTPCVNDEVYEITTKFRVVAYEPYFTDHIRPAFYLNLNNLLFSQGDGATDNPFIIEPELYRPISTN